MKDYVIKELFCDRNDSAYLAIEQKDYEVAFSNKGAIIVGELELFIELTKEDAMRLGKWLIEGARKLTKSHMQMLREILAKLKSKKSPSYGVLLMDESKGDYHVWYELLAGGDTEFTADTLEHAIEQAYKAIVGEGE